MSKLNLGDSFILDTDYSTSEVKTGATWIDGKPIYRKVFVLNAIVADTWTTYDSDTTHNVINAYGKVEGYQIPFYQPPSSEYYFVVFDGTYKAGRVFNSGYIVQEYTKTTD